MSEAIQTTKLQIVQENEHAFTVKLPGGESLSLPKKLFPAERVVDGYYFLTITNVPGQDIVSKDLAQNLLNELINAPLLQKE